MPSRFIPVIQSFEKAPDQPPRDTHTDDAIRSLQQVEIIEGRLLKDLSISNTPTDGPGVPHGLGREYRGFIPTKPIGEHVIHINDAHPSDKTKFIGLKLAKEASFSDVYGKVTIGGTGAPTLVTSSGASDGVKSITRNSAGTYTLVLGDPVLAVALYDYLRFAEMTVFNAAADDVRFHLAAESVSADGVIKFFTLTGGTATDPASGSTLLLHFVLEKEASLKTDVWVF